MQQKRWKEVRKRASKVKSLRRKGASVSKLVRQSLLPAGRYGAGVSGATNGALAAARTAMHGALVKNVAGRSATIGLALLSKKAGDCDPAVHMMTDPIFYLASALWDSWADRGMILRSALAAQRKLADAPSRWQLVRHPIEAALASAHRIGWRLSCNASGFVTAGGDTMEFDVCCPRDIQAVAIVDAELWLLQNAVDRAPFLAGFRGTPFLEPHTDLGALQT